MKKKELLAGIYNVYAVFDKVSKHYKKLYFATNDETFVRDKLPEAIIDTPLRDMTVFKIGIFNDVTGEIKQTIKKRLNTECYYFPHSRLSPPGENESIEKIEEVITDTKNQIIASVGSKENENKEVEEHE